MHSLPNTSAHFITEWLRTSNGNASETKAEESFDNGVFFDIEANPTPSIVSKLFSKRSKQNQNLEIQVGESFTESKQSNE